MPIGESLGITLPTVYSPPSTGTAGPAWATSLNAALTAIITAVETPVTTDGLNINANLEFNNFQALEVGAVGLENKASAFGGALNIVKVYVYNGELYYNDANGTAVQITANGSLNAAALAGIGGDYGGADPAALNYTASTSTFVFLENTAGALRALIDSGQHLLRATAGAGYAIKLTAPAGLTGDVDRTFLSANPASTTSLLQISTAGVESATLSPSLTGVTITESGIRRGQLTRTIPTSAFRETSGGVDCEIDVAGTVLAGGAASLLYGIPLEVGERLISVLVRFEDDSAGTLTVSAWKALDGAPTQLGATFTSAGDGSVQSGTVTGLTETGTTLTTYYILVGSLASTDKIYAVQYVTDRVV